MATHLYVVGLMGCRTYGLSDLWAVGLMDRRIIGRTPNIKGIPVVPISLLH